MVHNGIEYGLMQAYAEGFDILRVEQRTDRSDGMFGQERKNKTRDLVVLLVQGEMADVEQMDFAIRQIALERLRTGSDERGIVPPRESPPRRVRSLSLGCSKFE